MGERPERKSVAVEVLGVAQKSQDKVSAPYIVRQIAEEFAAVRVVTSPTFCTTTSERVYITARACELELSGTMGLQAAGAGGL